MSDRERFSIAAHAGKEKATPAPEPAPNSADYRRSVRRAEAVLFDNGRLALVALSSNIDRRMNQLDTEAEIKVNAFAAVERVKMEYTKADRADEGAD